MKSSKLFVTFILTAFAAMNVMATDALLSPRAAEQQVRSVSQSTSDPDLTAIRLTSMSPRFVDNQIKTVAGKDDTVAPSFQCARHMSGAPKAIDACAQHPGVAMPCCSVAGTK